MLTIKQCQAFAHASRVSQAVRMVKRSRVDLIIIMYIYHVLINALGAHMIHINLNMIFYTHVEHSSTKTIYIKYYKIKICTTNTHTHTDCSRNWVLILVRMKTLWEEEGFQFGFKRWQGWAVSMVLWEWIPNVGSKAREAGNPTIQTQDSWLLHKSHESCICIVGFPACGCQKKSIEYETERRYAAVQRGKQDQNHL